MRTRASGESPRHRPAATVQRFHVGGRKVATNTKHSADVGQSERVDLPSRDAIALRAYALFEARGREPGRDIDDWLRAEHELKEPRQLSPS